MLYMICYDITSDNRRKRVQKILEGYGDRVQYSVFECNISDTQSKKLRKKILSYINDKSDGVIFYPICRGCKDKIEYIGSGAFLEDEHYFMI